MLSSLPLDSLMLLLPVAIAALVLLFRHWPRRDRKPKVQPRRPRRGTHRSARPPKSKTIIVDGSNVMHWKDGTPRIETLIEVLHQLDRDGYAPGVVFDANAGYKLEDRYLRESDFARLLDMPQDRIMVVPSGEQADPVVLAAARDFNAPILSNDRFRDRLEDHPEIRAPGKMMRGGYRNGELWLKAEG